ncbi:MAG: glycoside hydrolase family 3 C-terminal domain-containing protein [Clostridia bacterium]|nr:glycoside hydrolase family 3 C-terminal domain-containing protein [Clostridia bacterium]
MKIFKKKLWETLSVVMITLLVIAITVNDVTTARSGQINEFLGTMSYEIKETEHPDDYNEEDYVYFPQEMNFDNIEEYYRAVNERVEAEGLVLLKNDNGALPLDKGSKVSMILSGSAETFYATHGPGITPKDKINDDAASELLPNHIITLKRAFEEENKLSVNPDLYAFYKDGKGKTGRAQIADKSGTKKTFKTNEPAWSVYTQPVKNSIANYGDAAIVVITRISGEGDDVTAIGSDGIDGSYLSITAEEYEILRQIADRKASGEISRIVVLLNSAMTIQCDFLFDEVLRIDAAMWIGNIGGSGARAVAKALVGEVNPSGRLSDTFLKNNFAAPSAAYWKVNEGFASVYENADKLNLNNLQKYYGVYVENIYVGYRYFETRYEDYVLDRTYVGSYAYSDDVAYTFGYGLSYTDFEYGNFNVTRNGDEYKVSVTVRNTGAKAGKETVQIYLQKPYTSYDEENGVEKASAELVGFAKTDVLEPSAEETVEITVNREQFKSYDAYGAGTYILEAGKYYLTAAKDAHDAVNNILEKKKAGGATVIADRMVGTGKAALAAELTDVCSVPVDSETYSVATETKGTGNEVSIVNQLSFMDPNLYDGVINTARSNEKVVYVSRADWDHTFPSSKTVLALTEDGEVKYDITSHKPIVEKEGLTMPKYDRNNDVILVQLRGLPYDDPKWNDLLDNLNFGEMVQMLTGCFGYTPAIRNVGKPFTDEDDGPYGVSHSPYGYSSMSCEGIIASTFNKDIFREIGKAFALDARCKADKGEVDVQNLNGLYSPGLNMHRCAFGGRASEYFSEDPVLSAIASRNQIEEMQARGVVSHIKHFILNDEESRRNGICIWGNEQSVREIYLLPWEWSIRPSMSQGDNNELGAHAIMTSFNRTGAIWSSASDSFMMNILRNEWKFDGYALTDMADSNAGVFMTYDDGYMNGTDCFLGMGSPNELDKWANSVTFNNMLRDSAHRVLYVTANYSSAMNGISEYTRFVKKTPLWQAAVYTVLGVFAGLTAVSVSLFAASMIIDAKKKKIVAA